MIRELLIAVAVAGAAIGAAPGAVGDPERYDSDVQGMNYDASLGAPCYSWERFVFGRGPDGELQTCRFIPNQWPPVYNGFWVISYPLHGIQEVGTPCPDWRGGAAQTTDGLALICTTRNGWQVRP